MSSQRKSVFLVWEVVPEATQFYFESVSHDDFEKMMRAHGTFLNTKEANRDTEWLQQYLCTRAPVTVPLKLPEGTWVVHSGFVL